MKKVLSAALALGLVAGVASTAAAYDSFAISGYYEASGKFITNHQGRGTGVDLMNTVRNTGGVAGDDSSADWWEHDLRLYPNLFINDKTALKGEVRLLDGTVWGDPANGGDSFSATTADREVDINKMYMEWKSPVGTMIMGRIPWGTYGTSTFNDGSTRRDGIKLTSNFLPDPLTLSFGYAKYQEDDSDAASTRDDMDQDYYMTHVGYKTDSIDTGGRIAYSREARTDTVTTNNWSAQAYGKYTMGNMFVNSELIWNFGNTDSEDAVGQD